MTTKTRTPAGTETMLLALTRDGRIADEAALDTLAQRLPAVTDCFVFCHGWLYDRGEARTEAARFFSELDGALEPLRDRVTPLRVALHWPSKPFAGESDGQRPHEAELPRGFDSGASTRSTDLPLTRSRRGRPPRSTGAVPHRPIDATPASPSRAVPTEEADASPDHASIPTAPAWPDLLGGLDPASIPATRLRSLLLALAEAEVPHGPEEELELDRLLRALREPTTRGGLPLSPVHAFSFWLMKRRAGEVGERLGREHLGPLFSRLTEGGPRLHLIGHSFGAKVLASAVLAGLGPRSLTLLLGAFSAFAFAKEVPGTGRPGCYRPLLDERRVAGSIVVLRSAYDRALGSLYPAVTGSVELGRTPNPGRLGHVREVVAASALGAVGARGVGAPDLDLVDVQRTGLPRQPVVNVDGSRIVRAVEFLVGAHRDIHHPEIATLVLLAAGLLQGGPEGVRRPPLSPWSGS
jgi:hypothetical protein